jgi:hypothetical protein
MRKSLFVAVWVLYQISGAQMVRMDEYATKDACELNAARLSASGGQVACAELSSSPPLRKPVTVERTCTSEFNRRTLRYEPVCTGTLVSPDESVTVQAKCTTQFNRTTLRNERVCTDIAK